MKIWDLTTKRTKDTKNRRIVSKGTHFNMICPSFVLFVNFVVTGPLLWLGLRRTASLR